MAFLGATIFVCAEATASAAATTTTAATWMRRNWTARPVIAALGANGEPELRVGRSLGGILADELTGGHAGDSASWSSLSSQPGQRRADGVFGKISPSS
jgi:hypothetical protein